jgi:hypothetical protein
MLRKDGQLLRKDGQLRPGLRGVSKSGVSLEKVALDMLKRRRKAFAKDPKNPRFSYSHVIDIDTQDAAPIADKARRWAQKEAEFIMERIRELRDRGQIERSDSPWACNPVLVVQGDKIRFCIDFRRLNSVTRRDSHGIGNMEELMSKVSGAKVISSLDLAAGYHQLPLSVDARAKTAFRAPDGSLWQYLVAPFGLVNLPAQFTRVMHSVLGSAMGAYALVYIDDVLVYGDDVEQHIEQLDEVLRRIELAGMSVSRGKCNFFEAEVKFLGHIVGAQGIKPDPEKVKAMADMAEPLKEGRPDRQLVQVAMGTFNYYRKYVENFAKLAAPLIALTKKDSDMRWGAAEQNAFRALKQALCNADIVRHPDLVCASYCTPTLPRRLSQVY